MKCELTVQEIVETLIDEEFCGTEVEVAKSRRSDSTQRWASKLFNVRIELVNNTFEAEN